MRQSYEEGWVLACANILKLIQRPGHSDMLRARVYYEAQRSLNQNLMSILGFVFTKNGVMMIFIFFLHQTHLKSIEHLLCLSCFN